MFSDVHLSSQVIKDNVRWYEVKSKIYVSNALSQLSPQLSVKQLA